MHHKQSKNTRDAVLALTQYLALRYTHFFITVQQGFIVTNNRTNKSLEKPSASFYHINYHKACLVTENWFRNL